MALINCGECGKEISDQAAACPNCGCPILSESNMVQTPQASSKKKSGKGCLISVIIFIIFICMFGLGSMFLFKSYDAYTDDVQKQVSGVTNDDEYITLDEYNAIEMGMTYEEVVDIVGSGGSELSRVESDGYQIVIVSWYGNGMLGSNANVTFENGKVTARAQVGLISDSGVNSNSETPAASVPEDTSPSPDTAESTTLEDAEKEETIYNITIPKIYFYESPESLAYNMENSGIETSVSEDYILTATMDQTSKDEFLENYRETISGYVDKCLSLYPECTKIEINDTYSSLDVYYGGNETNSKLLQIVSNLMLDCLKYQIIDGTSIDDVDLILTIISADGSKQYVSKTWKEFEEGFNEEMNKTSDN